MNRAETEDEKDERAVRRRGMNAAVTVVVLTVCMLVSMFVLVVT